MKTIKNLKAEEIRKSILQLAIQGKLVKQDPNDEPASELVKRIYAEKQRLIKEGKIKKDKNESYIFKGDDNCYYEKIGNSEPVKLEDLPFDIPDNWAWIRLKSLANIFNGNSINEEEKRKKYMGVEGRDFIATKDVGFDRTIAYNNGVNIPYDSAFKIAPAGKVLMCIEGGSAGRKIAITNKDVCFGNKLACFDTIIISDLYLFHILQSNEFLSIFKSSLSGIIGGVSINTLKDFIIPLPPIEEELRIVDEINSFEPLIAQYSAAENRLSILEEEFSEKLKKSILQYAIEGKLVKQDPNDEPASVLLERIKAEKEKLIKEGKIKRDKNESYIFQGDDKNYYEKIDSKLIPCDETTQITLPINWAFCYFGNVSTYGYTTTKMRLLLNSWLLELEDIASGSSVVKTRKYVEKNTNLNSKVPFKSGMVLYSKLRPYLDKIVIADQDGIATSEIVPFYSLIDTDYLVTFLRSPYFLNRVTNLMYGVKMPRLGTQDMTMTIVPLPPLSEQKRIVKKILSINEIISG